MRADVFLASGGYAPSREQAKRLILEGLVTVDGKPLRRAAEEIGTIPAETVVLEDSYNGIRAAHAGGFIACMVPDLREPDEEISVLLTRRFDTLADVIPFLEENTACLLYTSPSPRD